MRIPDGSLRSFLKKNCTSPVERRRQHFPRDLDYSIQFSAFEEKMREYVHDNVTAGAISHDRGRLTEHGFRHVNRVIQLCGALIDGSHFEISPYEAYLLLMAAHVHDIGNIWGRAEHERRAAEVLQASGIMTPDAAETRAIQNIASAHAGTINGSRDTIGGLPIADNVMGKSVRFQSLAAILRLADELSDDMTRADLVSLQTGKIKKDSEIFHAYAARLEPVAISHASSQISMKFELRPDDITTYYGRPKGTTLLFHEILRRTLKLFREMAYTSNFLIPHISLRRVSVTISLYRDHEFLENIGYRISTEGLYSSHYGSIYDLSPELRRSFGPKPLTAKRLRERLKEPVNV